MKQFLIDIQPALFELLSVIVSAAITWAAIVFKQKTGVEIQKKYQDDLHRALDTGIKAAIQKLSITASTQQLVEHAVEYAHTSVPDAIKSLEPEAGVMSKIATAKVNDAKAAELGSGLSPR